MKKSHAMKPSALFRRDQRFLGIALAHFDELTFAGAEGLDHHRVKVLAGFLDNHAAGHVVRKGPFVNALGG